MGQGNTALHGQPEHSMAAIGHRERRWMEMDKRTRVLHAMNGEEVDHVPVAFWFHFSGEEALGDANVQAHLKYYRDIRCQRSKSRRTGGT